MSGLPDGIDHLIVVAPDVDAAVDELERRIGVRAAPGGRHPAWGTRNALIGLGERRYLEILGPDPEAARPAESRPLGMSVGEGARLASWVIASSDLEAVVAAARRAGVESVGAIEDRNRQRPDGVTLAWRMTDARIPREDGIVPFFIDWGSTPHPATTSPPGGTLVGLRAEHPGVERVTRTLRALGIDLAVERGARPALIATLETPAGRVELR